MGDIENKNEVIFTSVCMANHYDFDVDAALLKYAYVMMTTVIKRTHEPMLADVRF